MLRETLLEMCVVSLLSLPDEELSKLLPALSALAAPHLGSPEEASELHKSVHECIEEHFRSAG